MPAKLLVLYKKPQDSAAFDRYYWATHAPLAKKIPGVRSYTVSKGPVGTPSGPAPYHLVAELTFDSLKDLQAGLMSPEGGAAAGDLPNFASGGVELLIYEVADA